MLQLKCTLSRCNFPQHDDRYCLFLYTGDKTHQLLVCHKRKNKMKKINNSLCLERNRSFGKSRGDSSLLTCSKEGTSITALLIPPRCIHRLPPSDFSAFLVPPAGKWVSNLHRESQKKDDPLAYAAHQAIADLPYCSRFLLYHSKCTTQTLRARRNERTLNHQV